MDGWSIIANGVQENFILKSPYKLSSNFGCTRTLNFPSSHVYGHTAINLFSPWSPTFSPSYRTCSHFNSLTDGQVELTIKQPEPISS